MRRIPRAAGIAALVVASVLAGVWLSRSGLFDRADRQNADSESGAAGEERAEDAEPQQVCGPRTTAPVSVRYGAFRLDATRGELACAFTVTGPNGSLLAEGGDWLLNAQYVDFDADGSPELLVVAESGGSGGFNTAYLLTQQPQPRLVSTIGRGCSPAGGQAAPGQPRPLITCDLLGLSGEATCNACTARPTIFLMLEDGRLRDRSSRFTREYDRYIEEYRATVTDADLKAFLATTSRDDAEYDSPARWGVLRIAADYVYSGREPEALDVLQRMWPAWDRQRIFNAITEARDATLAGMLGSAGAVRYEPAVVRLTGTLSRGAAYDAQDAPATFPLLLLDDPVDVQGSAADELNVATDGVVAMQLVMADDDLARKYQSLVGQPAHVTGTLYHSHTAHHYTQVLLQVQAIDAAP